MEEKQKHKKAFELYYLTLHEGKSIDDSIVTVTKKFKISERTAWRWKKEFDWDSKISIREVENNKTLEEKTNKTVVDNKVKYLGIVHASLNKYTNEVKKGIIQPIPIETPKDLDKLIKLALLIQSQPTDIAETTMKVDAEVRLKRLKKIGAKHDYRHSAGGPAGSKSNPKDKTQN